MYKKLVMPVIFVIILTQLSYSQKNARQEYISKYQVLAIKEMTRSGIPASIILAQACLESADGKSQLARLSNNHFGIKCKTGWKGETVYYDDDEKDECFRSYITVEESYIDHSRFLMENFRYSWLFEYDRTDYKAWARGLKKSGYATATHYDKHLIGIIEDFELHKLDLKRSEKELANFETIKLNHSESNGLILNPYKSHKVEKMNRLKSIIIREGDSFETIAQEFGMEDWELYVINDYPRGYRPQPNEIIYIQPKKRKATRNTLTHTVEPNESMHFISQMYGIKLRPLLTRNRLQPGEQPNAGQVIYLRKKAR